MIQNDDDDDDDVSDPSDMSLEPWRHRIGRTDSIPNVVNPNQNSNRALGCSVHT